MSQSILTCPQCNKEGLIPFRIHPGRTSPDVLQQTCKLCNYPFSANERLIIRDLPPIRPKRIIYLDQNIIGDIVRALHPSPLNVLRPEEKARAMAIFTKLDYLRRAQCIVCPYSSDHRDESALAKNITANTFRDLMRVYRYLANDIQFVDTFNIQMDQIVRFTGEWLGEKQYDAIDYNADDVFEANPHHWHWEDQGPFSYVTMEGEAEERKKVKDEVYQDVLPVYRRWRSATEDQITEDESLAFSKYIFTQYAKEVYLKMELGKGKRSEELQAFIPDTHFHAQLLWTLRKMFDIEVGLEQSMKRMEAFAEMQVNLPARLTPELVDMFEAMLGLPIRYVPEIREMFESEEFRRWVPFVRNESSMNAYLGKVTKGRRKDIGKGEMTDINRIAYHLPYCDAIVTDEFWSKAFAHEFITSRISTTCRLFHLKAHERLLELGLTHLQNTRPVTG